MIYIYPAVCVTFISENAIENLIFQNSHFLSAEECIMAADFQNQFPNACHFASDGHFGSKFVTVVVTGDLISFLI